jgi:TRAP-type mannitol/chloroaromatic compound transport system permease small subunit
MGDTMAKIEKYLGYIDRTNEWCGRILSYLVPVMTILIVIEIVMRYFFDAPTCWNNELTQMIFGTYAVLAGGFVLLRNGHVHVDLIISNFSRRTQALLFIILTAPLFFLFTGMLLYHGTSFAWESLMVREHSQSAWNPPVYPWKMMLPLGGLLMLLQGIALLIRNVVVLVRGEDPVVTRDGKRGDA